MPNYLVHEQRFIGPATHVLAIGVGAYPHLLNGIGPLSPHNDGMRQLTSPSASARMFASWFIERYHNPNRPLGTVSLLLSEASRRPFTNSKSNQTVIPEIADYTNVAAAIANWKSLGEIDARNLLIFYFCGHGIAQGPDIALLLSDYGCDSNAPLDRALDFRRFRQGMARYAPRQQLYFIDTCRASTDTIIEAFGNAGRVPIHPGQEMPAETPVYYATLAGEEAFGMPNQVSLFTGAILKGLNGTGSDNSEGDWRVTTTRLKEAIEYHVRQAFETGSERAQVPPTDELTMFEIHHLLGQPEVPVMVTCEPETENNKAEFICEFNNRELTRRQPAPTQWSLTLNAGQYLFRAKIRNGTIRKREKEAWVRPIYLKVRLEV